MKFSIETAPDGEKITVINQGQEAFAEKPVSSYSAIARKILLDQFKGQVLPLRERDLARFRGKQAGEYAQGRTILKSSHAAGCCCASVVTIIMRKW